MIRPLLGETFNECKAFYWSYIHTSQELIKAIQNCSLAKTPLAKEVISQERQIIKQTYVELKELQRWWEKEGKNEQKNRLLEKTSTA